MNSFITKRSIVIAGHKTSVTLEHEFWTGLKEIAKKNETTLSKMVAGIDERRQQQGNLSSAIRLFVLDYMRDASRLKTMVPAIAGGHLTNYA